MSLHQLKAQRPPRVAARSFFEQALPLLLDARSEGFRAVGARIGFELEGEGGGRWTLDCARVALDPDPRSVPTDVALRMSVERFEQLMAGQLDVVRASAAGHIHIHGERALLARLAPLFAPLQDRLPSSTEPTTSTAPLERVFTRD